MANRNQFRRLGLADEVAAPALAPALAKLRHPKTLRRVLLTAGPVRVLAGRLFVSGTGCRDNPTNVTSVPTRQHTGADAAPGPASHLIVPDSQKTRTERGLVTDATRN